MTRYLRFVIPAGLLVVVLGGLLFALSDNLVFFHTPEEVISGAIDDPSQRFRLGGQVQAGSISATDEGVTFLVGDGKQVVPVFHSGAPQELFREGIGVVVEGVWDGTAFHSDTMLVKHDEQYRTEDGVYEAPDGAVTSS